MGEAVCAEIVSEKTSLQYGWTPAEMIIAQKDMIKKAASSYLDEGSDFGKIKGCGNRLVLFKSGAEKLAFIFGLAPEIKTQVLELAGGHREYTANCTLYNKAGERVVSCSGLATTMESKYRYRKVGYGKERVENPDIADVYNTILKMAEKRALVAAILIATSASSMFTQDLEDMTPIQAEPMIQPRDLHAITSMLDELGTSEESRQSFMRLYGVSNFEGLTEAQAQNFIARIKDARKQKVAAVQVAPESQNYEELTGEDIEFE